jgi:hypothetical protein
MNSSLSGTPNSRPARTRIVVVIDDEQAMDPAHARIRSLVQIHFHRRCYRFHAPYRWPCTGRSSSSSALTIALAHSSERLLQISRPRRKHVRPARRVQAVANPELSFRSRSYDYGRVMFVIAAPANYQESVARDRCRDLPQELREFADLFACGLLLARRMIIALSAPAPHSDRPILMHLDATDRTPTAIDVKLHRCEI